VNTATATATAEQPHHPKIESPFRQPKAVWAVAFACVISFMGIGLVDPILPALGEQLHASPSQVSLLFTSYLLITAIAMLVTGWVSSRIGAKRTLVVGLVLIVIFAALAGASGSIAEIVGFRAGWGLGNALFIATSLAVIVASASGGFAGAIILYETALGVGIAMGPLVGGVLGAVSWRLPFFGVAVLMSIALIATLVLVEKTPTPAKKLSLLDPIKALRHRGLATISVTALCYNWGFFTMLAYSPFPMGLTAHQLGAVFTGWGVMVALFAVFAAPWLERRFGTVRTLYVNLALMSADLFVMGIGVDSTTVLVVSVIVAGAFIGLNNTLVTQAVMSVSPVERPIAAAAYSFVRFLGGGLAPFVAGKIAEATSPHVPFYVGAGVIALGIVVLATAHRLLRGVERGEIVVTPAEVDQPAEATQPEGEAAVEDGLAAAPGYDRPVLVAVDDSAAADAVTAAAGRLATALGSPVEVVHVPESLVVGDAMVDRDTDEQAHALVARRIAELRAGGLRVSGQVLNRVGDHLAVGRALAELATRLDARTVVVGAPSEGPLIALVHPSADAPLWHLTRRPVVVVPSGEAAPHVPGTRAGVRGQVRGHDGTPVAAVLTAIDASGHQLARTNTDADGGFRIDVPHSGAGMLLCNPQAASDGEALLAPTVDMVTFGPDTHHDVLLTPAPVPR
jgi:ACDE family multidrug resistance protein